MKISVVVPTLDEESAIAATLASTQGADEVVVVDGGSRDATAALAAAYGARVVVPGVRGRGLQLEHGARLAGGDILLFLHADTVLPDGFADSIRAALASQGASWGRFDVRFDRAGRLLRLIAWLISRRSRLTRSATGDQAIFVTRELFERVGGFRERLLFEDVDLCRRLRRMAPMGIPSGHVVTSSRRWRSGGVWRTTLRMWTLKLLYLSGVPAERLMAFYENRR
jgi:rSAM/selenodomain-associated transferase 2